MNSRIQELQKSLSGIRQEILEHELYSSLTNSSQLQTFMECHVFAVWDFMSLVKTLQARLTCIQVPWVPKDNSTATRLINEIVLSEESDEHPLGGYISHFELYRQAMKQAGADIGLIDGFTNRIAIGQALGTVLDELETPSFIADFLQGTFSFIENGALHEIVAVFTFGREEIIPSLFQEIVKQINKEHRGHFDLFQKYLERHIDLDGSSHTPLALRLVSALCGEDEQKWREAQTAAHQALVQRKVFWDGILKQTVAAIKEARAV